MDVNKLVEAVNGTSLTITGGDAGQCTAVPHKWEQMLGLAIVYGNATDTYANAPGTVYDKELNSPTGVPKPGAVVVWKQYAPLGIGQYGHTAVVVRADVNTLTVIEQNAPVGTKCRVRTYANYGGVFGWFYPKVLNQPAPAPKPDPAPTNVGEPNMTVEEERQAYQIVLQREPEAGAGLGQRTGIRFILDARGELAEQRTNAARKVQQLEDEITSLNNRPPKEVIKEVPVKEYVEKEVIVDRVVPADPSTLTLGELVKAALRKLAGIK